MEKMKIALVGSLPFFERTLCHILEESGYEVSNFKSATLSGEDIDALNGFDLFILSPEHAPGGELSDGSSCPLSTGGTISVGEENQISVSFSSMEGNIDSQMSPEEIVHQVNSVIFRTNKLRKSPRVTVKTRVEYEYEDRNYRSEITTISTHGVFISTLNPPPEGSMVKICFSIPGGGGSIEAVGRVLYSIRCDLARGIITHPAARDRKIIAYPGMGVLFEEISAHARETITAFIRMSETA